MISQELAAVVGRRWPSESETDEYVSHLREGLLPGPAGASSDLDAGADRASQPPDLTVRGTAAWTAVFAHSC